MPSEIIITTDKGTIDLYQGAETAFYVTRQIHDLHNFETRNADFSKSLSVPPTPNNLGILGIEQNDPDQQGIGCNIQMGGIMIAPVAFLFYIGTTLTNDEEEIKIQILYGNFNFINTIESGSINEINWADLAVIWSVANIIPLSQNTEAMKKAAGDTPNI